MARDSLNISFVVNHIYINGGWSPWDTRIGGSEEMVVETSKELAKRGHKVQVFHNGRHGSYKGVEYREHDDYEPGDITVNMNFPQLKPQGKTVFWTTLDHHSDLAHFDAVCVISQYAKDHTGVPKDSYIVPPGYDPAKIYPGKKIPKQCFYASSPDRGLDVLLEAWPDVVRAHPDATLLLTYGAPVTSLKGVINLGEIDEDTVNEIYRTSDIWCHPCTGVELYCMVGVKAQVAECVPVIIPHMALGETVKEGYFSSARGYTETLIEALGNKNRTEKIRNMLPFFSYPTWQDTATSLEKVIKNVLL